MSKARTYIKRAYQFITNKKPILKKVIDVGIIQYGDSLADRKILITGGSKGLGYCIAKKCLDEGAKVAITGRSKESLEEAAKKLGETGVSIIPFDIQNIDDIDILIENAKEMMGGLDSVVSNAGVSLHENSWDAVTHDQWDLQMNTNLKGSYFLAQSFFQYAERQNLCDGNFILMASERGLYGDDLPYGLGKAAMINLTMGLAQKTKSTGIRVNAVAPGVTATEMTGHSPDGNLFRKYAVGKRILISEEIAETTAFLLSTKSKCISGAVIPCNEANHLR